MTKEQIKYEIIYLIRVFGCAKYYIYFEKPLILLNGIKIKEIRLHVNDTFTLLTIHNGYVPCSKLKKGDLLLILEGIKDNI